MLQHFHILTLTHRQSELKDIGCLVAAFDPDGRTRERLVEIKERQGIDELFYLATCNRITLCFTTRQTVDEDFKVALIDDPATANLRRSMIHYQGNVAINHLFEIAASIDSLVIGERQILGQLRESYEKCRNWGLTGDDLRIIFDRTVLAAKDVYANTRIGEKSVSIVSLAVRKMLAKIPQKDARILLVGAGQTNNLVAKFLRKYDYQNITVFNRSLGKAEQLATSFANGKAYPLTELTNFDQGFDVLFVCTGATDPIIHAANIGGLVKAENPSHKLVVDLAVPNNVHESALEESAFQYVAVEDLRQLAQENMAFRGQEIQRSRELLQIHLEELTTNYRQRLLERALHQLPVEIKAVKQKAVDQVFAKELEDLDPETRELMERMLSYMEKKCIGIPMKAAREALIG